MKVITAQVVDGRIEAPLEIADGAHVAILAPGAEEPFELSATEKRELKDALADIHAGRSVKPPKREAPGIAAANAATDGLPESEWRLFRSLARKEALSEISEEESEVLEELQAKRLRYIESPAASIPPGPSMKHVEAAYENVLRALQHYADTLRITNPTRVST